MANMTKRTMFIFGAIHRLAFAGFLNTDIFIRAIFKGMASSVWNTIMLL